MYHHSPRCQPSDKSDLEQECSDEEQPASRSKSIAKAKLFYRGTKKQKPGRIRKKYLGREGTRTQIRNRRGAAALKALDKAGYRTPLYWKNKNCD